MPIRSEPPASRGLLLTRGGSAAAAAWVRRGIVPARVLDLGGWTAISPAGTLSHAAPPYDRSLTVLAAAPLGRRLRPAVGFFALEGRAVITFQTGRWAARQRWLVWQVGVGPVRSTLPTIRPADLMALCAPGPAPSAARIIAAIRSRPASPIDWLEGVRTLLGLPGEGLLTQPGHDHGPVVVPAPARVAAFDQIVKEKGPQ